jgi:hypothetical protein
MFEIGGCDRSDRHQTQSGFASFLVAMRFLIEKLIDWHIERTTSVNVII